MIALVFPFQSEMEAFLTGLASKAPSRGSLPLKTLRSALPLREEHLGGFRTWRLASHPSWLLVVSGQGKVETALACQAIHSTPSPPAPQVPPPHAYLLLGSASALDPSLRPGDLVLADPGIEADFQPDAPPPRFPAQSPFLPDSKSAEASLFNRGPVISADRNLFDPEEKRKMFAAHQALAYAWEGAGFHRFLRRNRTLGWEIRLITETATEARLPLATLQTRMAQGFPAVFPILESLGNSLREAQSPPFSISVCPAISWLPPDLKEGGSVKPRG